MRGNRADRRAATRGREATAGCSRAVPLRRVLVGLSVAGLAAGGSVAVAAPASAATFSVTTTADAGPGSLRQAILDSNATLNVFDTITFAPGVTGTIALTSGRLDITDAVRITGPGAAALTVDGTAVGDSVMYVQAGNLATTTISGLTVTGGSGTYYGGGLQIDGTKLALDHVAISNNSSSEYGGGVYAYESDLTFSNVTFTGNDASSEGGALFAVDSAMTASHVTMTGNTASSGAGLYWVGSGSSGTISDSTISGNTATSEGGGVYLEGGTFAVTRSVISGNHAATEGGGVYTDAAHLTLTDSTISGNQGHLGGGLYTFKGQLDVSRSTISGNTADDGGALYTTRGTAVSMTNSTVTANTSPTASIILEKLAGSPLGSASFDHVTVARNTGGKGIEALNAVPVTLLDSIVYGSTGLDFDKGTGTATVSHSLFGTTNGAANGTSGNKVGVDPHLGTLGAHGGSTQTLLPSATSPVVDAGAAGYVATTTDQRGLPRVAVRTGLTPVTDMGAVELTSSEAPSAAPSPAPHPAPTHSSGGGTSGGGSSSSGSSSWSGASGGSSGSGTSGATAASGGKAGGRLAYTGSSVDVPFTAAIGATLTAAGAALLGFVGLRSRRRRLHAFEGDSPVGA